ncbi:unnamed protein product [Onchocerca ochengi]|uniref:Uncharacterized protein n=1 Tax=Onchocerca ochengi TaxID=42157 RepID=A0A182ENB1_ONCOC|nr:unnamed protein product [Onchocerca ochengi]
MLPLLRGTENHSLISGFLRNSMRCSLRGGKTDHHGGIMNIVRQKFGRSASHSHFNTSPNGDDYGDKIDQNMDELSSLEKGYTKWMDNSGSRRSSLNRVFETMINESYDNPNVNLSDEDLPLTLKYISSATNHLGLSQVNMFNKLEDLEEESEEALSRKNTVTENILANHVNTVNSRNNDGKILTENVDGFFPTLIRQQSIPSNDKPIQTTVRRQKSYPKDNLWKRSSRNLSI